MKFRNILLPFIMTFFLFLGNSLGTTFGQEAEIEDLNQTQTSTKGYLYVELDVTDPEGFLQYQLAAFGSLVPFQIAPLSIGLPVQPLEGEETDSTHFFTEFQSPQDLEEWYYSEKYQEVIPLRLASTSKTLLVGLTGVINKADATSPSLEVPPAFLLARFQVTNPMLFYRYYYHAKKLASQYGGVPLVNGRSKGVVNVFEDAWSGNFMMLFQFPSSEDAQNWYHSEKYQKIRSLLENSTSFINIKILEGNPA